MSLRITAFKRQIRTLISIYFSRHLLVKTTKSNKHMKSPSVNKKHPDGNTQTSELDFYTPCEIFSSVLDTYLMGKIKNSDIRKDSLELRLSTPIGWESCLATKGPYPEMETCRCFKKWDESFYKTQLRRSSPRVAAASSRLNCKRIARFQWRSNEAFQLASTSKARTAASCNGLRTTYGWRCATKSNGYRAM